MPKQDRNSYMLGRAWMTKWSKTPVNIIQKNNTTTTKCGPCCDNSQSELHEAKAIVLCCMDFRLRDNQACHLRQIGYTNNYDEVVSAGSSLGYNGLTGYTDASWNVYINSHIELGYSLHDISEIIIVEHEKCGAYGIQYPDMSGNEINYHIDNVTKCGDELWKLYNPINGTIMTQNPETDEYTQIGIPNLKITAYLITINADKFIKMYQRSTNYTYVLPYQ